ncbi:hypothetical protein F9Y90_01260 [Borrelia miyamotoi]|uniref:Integrin-binding adhesin P66 family protein n=15 Tax=Borrelia TaxID=138 RepID=A0AAX3JL51_9SPIR|nr:integrin-binding adhesin P66 family protein [Borrelia miyamotoi]QFP41759.1 hypothetical protein F9Y90_01260 [Borrelia miyamotoi]QFP47879.1 integrin-binding adhesin P66 family protein [Borrelia miyamotoi]QGT55639.1 hypothetical protein GNY89_01265 [Borrelia miyamotoi]QGT56423.1 hypothetical protein GNY88_01265 [Borrelia miyamotoi]WAZ71670.1 integrin-binding adhesin P66 family protein [Borrelia miyamotoi]
MNKVILYFLIMTLSTAIVFAEDTDDINNEIKANQWTHKITFENKSEFRFDIDELTPGLQNQSQIGIKFQSPEKNKEIGKDDPFSAYIKIENVGFKAQGAKDAILKIDLGKIIANIKIYDFHLKMESMTNFDFTQESLFSFAPITSIQSKYYGFPSKDRAIGQKIFSKSKVKRTGTLQFGYNLPPQIEFLIAIGAIGTGNRNHQKNNDDSEEDKKKKKETPYNGTYKGIIYGTQLKWKPIQNILEQNSPNVIVETPFELNFGLSGGIGNSTFNHSSSAYTVENTAITNSDLVSPTLSNASIIASIGLVYKIGLTKINDKNTYLILKTGYDLGIDPFASDFSIFGHISKKANTNKDTKLLNPKSNNLNFNTNKTTNFAFSTGVGIGFAWNKDEGEKESWAISGSNSYSKKIFGEQDKKSGVGIGISYGQNLHNTQSSQIPLLKKISEKSFKTLNAELSTYEDNKKGLIPGLGWIASIGAYDLLKEYPESDNIINSLDTNLHDNNTNNSKAASFYKSTKIGGALYIDYAIPVESISKNAYITPYVGTHFLGSTENSTRSIYVKTGLELNNLIKLTTISLGWDSNNLLLQKDQKGSVFLQFKIAFSE